MGGFMLLGDKPDPTFASVLDVAAAALFGVWDGWRGSGKTGLALSAGDLPLWPPSRRFRQVIYFRSP
jgi:hypothetical protein